MPDTSAYAHAAQSVAGRESSVGPPLLRRQASAPSAGSGQAASQVVRALLSPAGLAPLPLDQWQAALPALAEQRLTPFVYAQRRLVRPASAGQRFVVELHWSLFELPYYVDLIPMAELWQAALAARYASFLSAGPASWQVTLGYGWDPEPGRGVYVEHGETWTRFGTEAYGGRLDLNRQHAVVAVASDERLRLALERTMVYLCLQALPLAGDRLLLLHAAGVARQGQGHVFLGPSGAGKTTVARLASGYGQVLCDENVVARLGEAGPEALSTPFWGLSAPPELIERVRRRAPLRAIFSLQQAPDFSLTPLTPAHAVLAMVESNRIVAEHPARADVWLDAAQRLLAQVPVYRLSFRPTTELWAFLDGAT
jgi:hypothetical protein